MSHFSLDRVIIYSATFLRALGLGMVSILLAIYLMQLDLSKAQVGCVISVGLIGAACGNILVTFFGDRIGRKKTLIIYALLSAAAGLTVCFFTNFYAILAVSFIGMLNARGKDRGAALVLETAIIPSLEGDQERTKSYAWFSIVQDVGLGLGGLLAGLPTLLTSFWDIPQLIAFKTTFGFYAVFMLLAALMYTYLSARVEVPLEHVKFKLSPEGKKAVTKIGSFFAIDSLAGGFLTSALLAYYFYERFGVSVEALGVLFLVARCLNAVSYLGAAWLAKKIGLINTMVFTHMPSSFILIAAAFAPTFPIAAALFLLREMLVEMDVPAKKSYLMAIVKPEERTTMSGVTMIVRMFGWAVGPAFAGFFMQYMSSAMPLFIGAGLKITYDILIYSFFRKIKPPEEIEAVSDPVVEAELATA